LTPTARSRPDPKILLIRFRRIGDVLLTTPAITLLKEHFPKARLTYLVEEPFRRLVEGNPRLDRVLVVPAKQERSAFLRLIRDIRREKFDVICDFHGGPRASWITLGSGAGLKVGHGIRHKIFLYDRTVPRKGADGPLHSVESHAGLVRALGVEFGKADIPPLSIPPARAEEAARVGEIAGAAKGRKLVVVHIGAGNEFRDWGAENIAALMKMLTDWGGLAVALIGGDIDRKREEALLGLMPDRRKAKESVIPLAGKLNLIEIRELISQAALFVGPDSGPMHLAAATAAPVVAYFGPTLPAHFGPWRPGVDPGRTVLLQRELDCRPCRQRECATADYRCLRLIAPADVYSACISFLNL
jgi:ADP-heptose:LPS heptosyltransferase